MSNENQNSNIVIVVSLITLIGTLSTPLFNNWEKIFKSNSSNDKNNDISNEFKNRKIELNIHTKDNNPLESVEVLFLVNGLPVSKQTNTKGYVSIKVPKTIDDIEVILKKDGFKTQKVPLNLQDNLNEPNIIYLSELSLNSTTATRPTLPPPPPPSPQPQPSSNKIDVKQPISSLPTDLSQSETTWRSKSGLTRISNLDKICWGISKLDYVQTIFDRDKGSFVGSIVIPSPKKEGCAVGNILSGNFNLSNQLANCQGTIIIKWKNNNNAFIKWNISNLGSNCPVDTKDWEIDTYPVSNN